MTTQRDLAINRLLETIKNQEAILKRLNKIIALAVIVVIIESWFIGWQIGKVQALQEINQTLQLQDRG